MSSTFDRYPEPGTILRFKNFKNVTKVPLTFIFDFESFLEPINEEGSDDTNIKHIQEHIPSAFALHCIALHFKSKRLPTRTNCEGKD